MINQEDKPVWKVIKVTDIMIPDGTSGPQRGYRVTYQMHNGTVSYVDVKHQDYEPDSVGDMVDNHAAAHNQVLSLKGIPLSAIQNTEPQY